MRRHNIPLVYVAGPYTGPTREAVEANITAAVVVGLEVARLGACPVIPHSNTSDPQFELLQNYEFWIAATAKLLTRCDAVITVNDWRRSKGASGEVELATEREIPVFHNTEDLAWWMKKEYCNV
jgi:nucleoside 2-deoxyribosyltransferase